MRQYTVRICGGLGDTILRLLGPGDCGYIEDLRRKDAEARFRCMLMSTCPASRLLVAPLFDELHYEPWDGDHKGFLLRSEGRRIDQTALTWRRPEIALTDDESKEAEALGSCVVLHPYAGTREREWADRVDLIGLIDRLCDDGHRVVLLGGSSLRSEGAEQTRTLWELFGYQRPDFVNMVGKWSVSLQVQMAIQAKCFVGSFSAYHCAAFCVDAPSLVLAPHHFSDFFRNAHPVYGTMSERDCTQIHYFDDGGIADRIVSYARGFL